jgi:hypothetical protein
MGASIHALHRKRRPPPDPLGDHALAQLPRRAAVARRPLSTIRQRYLTPGRAGPRVCAADAGTGYGWRVKGLGPSTHSDILCPPYSDPFDSAPRRAYKLFPTSLPASIGYLSPACDARPCIRPPGAV